MTPIVFMLWPVVSLVAGVLIVRLAAEITGGVKFDSWGATFGAVLVAYVIWWAAGTAVAGFLAPPAGGADVDTLTTQALMNAAIVLVFNIVSFALAGLVIPGMHIRSVLGLLLASLALTAMQLALIYLPLVLPVMSA